MARTAACRRCNREKRDGKVQRIQLKEGEEVSSLTVGTRVRITAIWNWLTPAVKRLVWATLIAFPVTIFMGQGSWQAFFSFISVRTADSPYWALDWATNTVAVLLLLIISSAAVTRLRRSSDISQAPSAHDPEAYRLLDDVALDGSQADEVGLGPFIARLSRTVVLPHGANSLVVGLEAPWGAGKSSALELLCRELARHSDEPLVIRFNPWLASGSDRILRAFFSQLSGSLRIAGEADLAGDVVRYAEMLEELVPPPARILPRMGLQRLRRIAGRIPEQDIEGERENLSKSVEAFGRPVVVIIDDIDRLPADDVLTVFQLVKAVASFPRVAYVLAFDPKPVDAALARDGMYQDGREFRDKIVQANIALPRVAYRARKKFLTSRLNQRFEAWKFTLLESEREALSEAVPLVLTALKTPRDIKRVLNKTLFSAEAVRNEVNIADVFVFETIHAIFPRVVDLIRQRPEVVNASDHESDTGYNESIETMLEDEESESNKRQTNKRLKDFTRMYPGRDNELGPLLMFLFKNFFDDSAKRSPAAHLRISERTTLLKLLYQELSGHMSAAAAMSFLSSPEDRRPQLAEAVETNTLTAWLAHVEEHVAGHLIPLPDQLLEAVAESVNDQFSQWRSDSSEEARWLTIAVLDATHDPEQRWRILEGLISNRDLIATTEPVLVSLLRDVGLWRDGVYLGLEGLSSNARQEFRWLDAKRLDKLRRVWVKVVSSFSAAEILGRFPNAGGILFRWKQLADTPAEMQAQLEAALADRAVAIRFINLFPPGIGLDGVKKLLTSKALQHVLEATGSSEIDDRTRERMAEYLKSSSDADPILN
jgi:predicted KAP-like P-loop ATPase